MLDRREPANTNELRNQLAHYVRHVHSYAKVIVAYCESLTHIAQLRIAPLPGSGQCVCEIARPTCDAAVNCPGYIFPGRSPPCLWEHEQRLDARRTTANNGEKASSGRGSL